MWPVGYANRAGWLCQPNVAVRLKYPNHGPDPDAHLDGYSFNREPSFTKPNDFITIEDPTRTPDCVPGLCAVRLGSAHAGADPFAGSFAGAPRPMDGKPVYHS
jgi:hypothetical protein